MQETYSVRNAETTPDRRDRKAEQARARRARQTERRKALNILNEMKELRVQRRLGEARKSKPVVAGDGKPRYFKIGANVAAMCCRLWYWENKGELAGHWTHKTARQWERETGLNERQQRTARRTAVEEGLWEEREHVRPDGRRVVKYRLDPVRMARLSVESAVESARRELGREVRAAEREKLARELPELEADRDLLRLFDAPEEPEGAGPDREPDTTPTYAVGDAPTQTPHGNAENGASEGERGDPQYTPEKELRYAENGASEGVGRTGTPYRVSGDPLQSVRGPLTQWGDYKGVLHGSTSRDFAYSDSSRGDANVARLRQDDAFVSRSEIEKAQEAKTTEGLTPSANDNEADEETLFAVYDQLDTILRGDGGRSGEILGPMALRHLEGLLPFERLVKTARGFVRTEIGDEDFAGIVAVVLKEMRAEGYVEDGRWLMGMDRREEDS